MTALFQNVKNIVQEVKTKISPYLYGLLLHDNRKTCASMARQLSIPVKRMYSSFKNANEKIATIKLDLQMIANNVKIAGEKRVLAIDGTMISKVFAEKIQNIAYDYDGVLRRATQGLSIIVASLLIGGSVFPLEFSFWQNQPKKKTNKRSKKRAKKDPNHKTKIMLAMQLISTLMDKVLFDYLAMDGAFASDQMIGFIEEKNLKYTMRIARSRKVEINGTLMKLREHKALRLIRNERCKTAQGNYKGHACFLTVNKRKKKNGKWETVYIISNMSLSAKEQVEAYNRRWPIDKSFRSQKQYLGLTDCQMCSEVKQTFHIFNVFLAYSLATLEKIANGANSVENILNAWRFSKKIQNFDDNNDLANT